MNSSSVWRFGLAAMAVALLTLCQPGFAQQNEGSDPAQAAEEQSPDSPAAQEQSPDSPDAQEQSPDSPAAQQNQSPREADERAKTFTDDGQQADQNGQAAPQGDRPFLGVLVAPSRGAGVFITNVHPEGPAAAAGIRPGDYVLSINGNKVSSPDELNRRIDAFQADEPIEIVRWRNGREQTLQVRLATERQLGYRGPEADNGQGDPGQQPWIGVLLSKTEAGETRIARTYPSGPAARAGLRAGDVILRIGEKPIDSPQTVAAAIGEFKPNDEIQVAVRRDDEEFERTIVIGSRDEFFESAPGEATGWSEDQDRSFGDFSGAVPEHAMMLEQHRKFAEQHERMENLLYDLIDEVQELRKEVQALKQQ